MLVSVPLLGVRDPRKGPGQVPQKADGVETLPTATELHSPSWLETWAEKRGTDIY